MEIANLRFPALGVQVDTWAHLGGYLVGILSALAYNRQEKERRAKKSWWDRVFQGESR